MGPLGYGPLMQNTEKIDDVVKEVGVGGGGEGGGGVSEKVEEGD